MLEPRWTYSNASGLRKWYGHVDYYGPYVIGQWFTLDADSGKEHWSRKSLRANTICGCSHDVIVASEMRSDGPWTADFGIYGISAQTGAMLWINHGRGLWGKLLRCFDYVPGFTNEFRDRPKCIVDQHVVTERGRVLEILTGIDCPSLRLECPETTERSRPAQKFYDNKSLSFNGNTIKVEGHRHEFCIIRSGNDGNELLWRFAAKDRSVYVDGNYYSYRIHNGFIFIILGDAPNYVPISDSKPLFVKPNPANYQMGVLNVSSGNCELFPLLDAKQRKECRIEAIRDSRMLISCDGSQLTEYEIAT